MPEVFQKSWGNLSTEGNMATVRSGNTSRDTATNAPRDKKFIVGSFCNAVQTAAPGVYEAPTVADAAFQWCTCLLDTNSIKADLDENAMVENFANGNAFTQVSRGQFYAAFDKANLDADVADANLWMDNNGVLQLITDAAAGASPYDGFVFKVPKDRISRVLTPGMEPQATAYTESFTAGDITYSDGVTWALVNF